MKIKVVFFKHSLNLKLIFSIPLVNPVIVEKVNYRCLQNPERRQSSCRRVKWPAYKRVFPCSYADGSGSAALN